jgi:hypothetical protein
VNALLRLNIGTQTTVINNNSIVSSLKDNCCLGSYTFGAVHPGITGTGGWNVHGIVGIIAEITTDLPNQPDQVGAPPYLWNRGWLSANNPDGMLAEQRLTRQAQIWLPEHMRMATDVAYWFPDGLIVQITELLPGP